MKDSKIKKWIQKCTATPSYVSELKPYKIEAIINHLKRVRSDIIYRADQNSKDRYTDYLKEKCRTYIYNSDNEVTPSKKRVLDFIFSVEATLDAEKTGRDQYVIGWELTVDWLREKWDMPKEHVTKDMTKFFVSPDTSIVDTQIADFKRELSNRKKTDTLNYSEDEVLKETEILCVLYALGTFDKLQGPRKESAGTYAKIAEMITGVEYAKYKSAAQYMLKHINNGTLEQYKTLEDAIEKLKTKQILG